MCTTKANTNNNSLDIDNDMYHLYRTIHLTSKWFGMLSFSINYDLQKRPKCVYISLLDVIYVSFVIGLRLSTLHSFYQVYIMKFPSIVTLFLHGTTLLFMVLFITLTVNTILDIFNRKKLLRIFQKISTIDNDLKLLQIQFNHARHTRIIIFVTIFTILIETAISASSVYTIFYLFKLKGSFIKFDIIAEVIVNFGISIAIRNFTIFLFYVNYRLWAIRNFLKKNVNQRDCGKYEFDIKIMRRTYDNLCDVIRDLNSCFGFQVSRLF